MKKKKKEETKGKDGLRDLRSDVFDSKFEPIYSKVNVLRQIRQSRIRYNRLPTMIYASLAWFTSYWVTRMICISVEWKVGKAEAQMKNWRDKRASLKEEEEKKER